MEKQTLTLAGFLAFLALILNFQFALAHETITVGDYTLEIGWLSEPPVVGQHNAIVVHITTTDEQPVEDVSSLTVTISYGGQSKTLTLEPLDEHSPGQYVAPIVPTIPGQYTVQFGGTLGDTPVDAHVEPEEVQPAETLEFPSRDATGQESSALVFGATEWLAVAGLLSGLAGLVLSLLNMRKNR